MNEYVIGVDLGTSICKCAIYDEKYRIISDESVTSHLLKISPSEIEQDPAEWWESVCRVISGALKKADIDRNMIKAIAISSQGIAFVPVDERGNPLRPAISWLDTRAFAENDMLIDAFGIKTLFSMTGKYASEYYTLPKILWLRNHEPELFRKTAKFLTAHDYVAAKLCDRFFTDHTLASGTMAYNIHNRDWDSGILEKLGLDRRKFPEILQSGSIAGVINTRAAENIGLNRHVAIVTGGQDQKCAALGAGVGAGMGRNEASVSLGTATAVTKLCNEAVIDPSMLIACFTGLGMDEWILEGALATSCACLDWLRDVILTGYDNERMDQIVDDVYKSRNDIFFYPFLTKPIKSAVTSIQGCFYGLSLSTSQSDLIKSVYEAIAYQIRDICSHLEKIGGSINTLRVFGGGAKSRIWCKMIADITGKMVLQMKDSETACRGAAMLAGLDAGLFTDRGTFAKMLDYHEFHPDVKMNKQYDDSFMKYINIQNNLQQ